MVLPSSTFIADEVFIFTTGSHIKLQFVEHSVRLIDYYHGEDQPGLLNQEHPTAIKKRVHEKVHREDGTILTANAMEGLLFSQSARNINEGYTRI